jgi:hypothetical protein
VKTGVMWGKQGKDGLCIFQYFAWCIRELETSGTYAGIGQLDGIQEVEGSTPFSSTVKSKAY